MSRAIVIKIGGGEGIDLEGVLDQFADLVHSGVRAVLVHGGSHETNVIAEQLGHPPQFLTSPSGHTSRRTDRNTLEIFEMVYCGKINKRIVEHLQQAGVNAMGLSGLDGGIWRGRRKSAFRAIVNGRTIMIRDDLSGRVDRVDRELLDLLLDTGRTPVLTPPAVTDDGVAINVDADRAAAATAAALNADELLLLSNVPGVLRDPEDAKSRIESASIHDLDDVQQAATGRMKNKVLAAKEALENGVPRVVIGSANGNQAIWNARNAIGTVFEGKVACAIPQHETR